MGSISEVNEQLLRSVQEGVVTLQRGLCDDATRLDSALADVLRLKRLFGISSASEWQLTEATAIQFIDEIEDHLLSITKPDSVARSMLGHIVYPVENFTDEIRDIARDGVEYHNPKDVNIRKAVYDLTDGHCAYCWNILPEEWHVDHLVPRQCGGPDNMANYVPSCPTCNISKNADHVIKFINRRFGRILIPPANDEDAPSCSEKKSA